jgi:hypothetical protein
VHRISEKGDYASKNEAHEREKLELRLENEMLKLERRLPAGKFNKEDF